jgi:hypothetical protein
MKSSQLAWLFAAVVIPVTLAAPIASDQLPAAHEYEPSLSMSVMKEHALTLGLIQKLFGTHHKEGATPEPAPERRVRRAPQGNEDTYRGKITPNDSVERWGSKSVQEADISENAAVERRNLPPGGSEDTYNW